MYRIVCIISPWAISLTSALNKGLAYNTYKAYIWIFHIYVSILYLHKNFELNRGWAYNTSWAYNTYYTVSVNDIHQLGADVLPKAEERLSHRRRLMRFSIHVCWIIKHCFQLYLRSWLCWSVQSLDLVSLVLSYSLIITVQVILVCLLWDWGGLSNTSSQFVQLPSNLNSQSIGHNLKEREKIVQDNAIPQSVNFYRAWNLRVVDIRRVPL